MMQPPDFSDGPNNGFLLVGAATAPCDNQQPQPWGVVPTTRALQPEFSGGRMDAHIILMHDPETGSAP